MQSVVHKKNEKPLWIMAAFFLVSGFAVQLAAPYTLYRDWQFRQSATRAQGSVSQQLGNRDFVSFRTLRGEDILVGSRLTLPWNRFSPGASVDILYLPKDPYTARLDTFGDRWALPIFLAGFGFFWTLGGLGLVLRIRSRRGGDR